MMQTVYEPQEALVQWTADQLGAGLAFSRNARAIGQERDGKLVACVVFDRINAANAEMSIATTGDKRWLNREYIARVFSYPFRQLDLERITCFVAAKNKPVINLMLGFGFEMEAIQPRALPMDDVLIFRQFNESCRWLPPRGQSNAA